MMSDVPVGVFLSGGVDSSTNVALMAELVDRPDQHLLDRLPTATSSSTSSAAPGASPSSFGTNHHEVMIDADDLWRFLPELVHHQDEPIADPVCVPLYFVSKLAKDNGVTVVHVGEGADELFAGYPTYVAGARSRDVAVAPAARAAAAAAPRPRAAPARCAQSLVPGYEIHVEALARAAQPTASSGGAARSRSTSAAWSRSRRRSCAASSTATTPRDVVAAIAADADEPAARATSSTG